MINHSAKRASALHDRRAIQAETIRALHMHIENLADLMRIAFEHDNFVRSRSAHQSRRVGSAWAFAQNFDLAPNKTIVHSLD